MNEDAEQKFLFLSNRGALSAEDTCRICGTDAQCPAVLAKAYDEKLDL